MCKFKWRLLSILTLICSISYADTSDEVSAVLKEISQTDRKALEDLFYILFSHGDFAYVYNSQKPMCSIDYVLRHSQEFSLNQRWKNETLLARRGFIAWKKIEAFFPMNEWAMVASEFPELGDAFSFLFIYKPMCLSIIQEHLPRFQKFINKNLSPEELLSLLCNGKMLLEGQYELLGLLLGYPEEDVIAFTENIECSSLSIYRNVKSKHLKPCRLETRKNPISPIKSPYFMTTKSDSEYNSIKKQFQSEKEALVESFYIDPLLEKILERLM